MRSHTRASLWSFLAGVLLALACLLTASCGRDPIGPRPCTEARAYRVDTIPVTRPDGTTVIVAYLRYCR